MERETQKSRRLKFEESELYNDIFISNGKTKYYINKELGYGSYSNIYNIQYSINDKITKFEKYNSPRCIKVFKKSDKYTEYAKKEVEIINKIKHPTLFVSIFDTFIYKDHFCIVSNKFDYNLYEYRKKFSISKYELLIITKQLLKGLIYLKRNKIIHGDLKPENILVNENKKVVTTCAICDFNLSYDLTKNNNLNNTDVTTLWYRAPEIYLDMEFSYEIDIWAFGCILYEIISEKSLFNPKCSTNNIVNNKSLYEQHLSFLGKCPYRLIENYTLLNLDDKVNFNSNIFKTGYQTIFSECIKWNPKKRILPEGCLKYLRQMIQN